ncbi:MAG: hypothetical protein ACLFOA_03755 [Desulfohalobiaceae bacterium]
MVAIVKKHPQCPDIYPEQIPEEITKKDREIFLKVINANLEPEQQESIRNPEQVFPRQREVLAVHWHPEYIPLDLAIERIDRMYPNRETELIIPTEHNEIRSYAGYSGVEVDCYSQGFNQKVQLLLHFKSQNIAQENVLQSMLEHTRKYRSSQLLSFMQTILEPVQERMEAASKDTGADLELIQFCSIYVQKIKLLVDEYFEHIPTSMFKNKLIRNFFDYLRQDYDPVAIDRCQNFLKAVKKRVKEDFSLQYFYRTSEIIEEARLHRAGVIIPHPEQFWPILLADYDVDGYEVWNPQSQKYTEFLISVVNRKNRESGNSKKLLIFMGDDTHLGEKVKDREFQDQAKAAREIGYQPAWEDLSISKKLIRNQVSRSRTIQEYKAILDG